MVFGLNKNTIQGVARCHNAIPDIYPSLPGNLMEKPDYLISHLTFYPVFPGPHSIPFE
jgi:hypothetical protein